MSGSDGLAIARERIAEELDAQTGMLDLGRLGLHGLPCELFALRHLRVLNLGSYFYSQENTFVDAASNIAANEIEQDIHQLADLQNLDSLHLCSTKLPDLTCLLSLQQLNMLNIADTSVSDLSPLQGLASLKGLDCSRTSVSDLSPLQGLASLKGLDCSRTSVSDLSPLQGLASLQHLNCFHTSVSDLSPLQGLVSLQQLNGSLTLVSDLSPLQGLVSLQQLGCSANSVSDLSPVQGLASLQQLICSQTSVSDLSPVQGLASLQVLNCWHTSVSDLSPLQGLASLQVLNCSNTSVSDLSPLQGLASLQQLECSVSSVSDLSPVQGLASLQKLICWHTSVSDLSPLQGLASLQVLKCSNTLVSDLSPLQGLASLQVLNCSNTLVSDLSPLQGLASLQVLSCSNTSVSDLSPLNGLASLYEININYVLIDSVKPIFWNSSSIKSVCAYESEIQGFPDEVLSVDSSENCLPAIRAHIADLGDKPVPLDQMKLMILGNGRIGKTQIANRLRGLEYEEKADSTHGVTVSEAPIPGDSGTFALWDFGGQDIYHGTHALFLKSRAVFMLVWTPESDNATVHTHGGMRFRNQPLSWWLDYVRRFGSEQSPLVVVQNQLDVERDLGDHPAVVPLRDEFTFCRSVAYSAATDEGREVLDAYLKNAASRFNPPLIGTGRDSVMKRLITMRESDALLAPDERRYRTLPLSEFESLCDEAGGVSSPDQFLRFLHNAGVVFWRERLFEDQVILDQAWVLDAIYTVFNREKCLQQLQVRAGRFTQADLGLMVWDEHYTDNEQALFISFMRSCGICFHISGVYDQESIYVAPDLLPDSWSPEERAERWGIEPADVEKSFSYDSLPPALMRNLICRIGEEAGIRCDYWRNGFYGFEVETASRVLFEQAIKNDWRGEIQVRTRGGKAQQLLDRLVAVLNEEEQRLGLSRTELSTVRAGSEPDTPAVKTEPLSFGQAPNQSRIFYVSYAWTDKDQVAGHSREQIVNDFCDAAEQRHIKVHRDKQDMVIGNRISAFMNRLARADRVILVLSDKYLKSPFCMHELHGIWMQSRAEDKRFLKRVRVYTEQDANVWTVVERAQYAAYWKREYDKVESIVQEHGSAVLGDRDRILHGMIQRFSIDIGNILGALTDVLQPQSLDELVGYSFNDDVFDDE